MLLLGTAAAASAQSFSDYFTLSYHGTELKDGDTVYITERFDEGDDLGFSYISHINVTNKTEYILPCRAVFQYFEPSMNEVKGDPDFWGTPSMCFSGAVAIAGSAQNSCLIGGALDAGAGTVWVPANGNGEFSWEPHLDFANGTAVSTYKLVIAPLIGEGDLAQQVTDGELSVSDLEEGTPITLSICYCETDPSTVETIDAEVNVEVKYYDLQGNKVAAPAKGLYIRVAGDKATKVIL